MISPHDVTSPKLAEVRPLASAGGRPVGVRPPRKERSAYPKLPGGEADAEARRLCATILEVLGGGRTPTDAAGALGVSLPRYYALEARGLGGLLRACQRRPKGRQRTPQAELERLRADVKRLESQCSRLQALVRVSQRAVGLPPPSTAKGKGKPDGSSKKRRKRRPAVRALRAARSLGGLPAGNSMEPGGQKRDDAREVGA